MAENTQKRESRNDDNVVYIGKKPTMSYVLAVMNQFSNDANEVHIKARGKSISQAVNVSQAVKNKFMKDLKHEVTIGTEEVQDKESGRINVSTINIRMYK